MLVFFYALFFLITLYCMITDKIQESHIVKIAFLTYTVDLAAGNQREIQEELAHIIALTFIKILILIFDVY